MHLDPTIFTFTFTSQGRADSLGFSWDGLVDDLKRNAEALEAEYEYVNSPSL